MSVQYELSDLGKACPFRTGCPYLRAVHASCTLSCLIIGLRTFLAPVPQFQDLHPSFGFVMSRTVVTAITVLTLAGFAAAATGLMYSTGSSDSSSQDLQPLPFSHSRHAGELRIDCLYCHRAAEVSPAAGVPSMQLCMSCHMNLAQENDGTRKLLAYWKDRAPIPWVRMHRLSDLVYFTHEMHLNSGLQCVNCHGNVDQMPYTPRAASYEMGWCLSCHQQRGASRDCWTCHQ